MCLLHIFYLISFRSFCFIWKPYSSDNRNMFSLTKCVQLLQKKKVVVIFGYIRWFVFSFPIKKKKIQKPVNKILSKFPIATQEFRTCVFRSSLFVSVQWHQMFLWFFRSIRNFDFFFHLDANLNMILIFFFLS